MSHWTIWHNPRCSKSRKTLEILKGNQIDPTVVNYLEAPPSQEELQRVLALLEGAPAALVRSKEEKYQQLKFDLSDNDCVAKQLAEHPELIERPVVIHGDQVVLGRPPENVQKLIEQVGTDSR